MLWSSKNESAYGETGGTIHNLAIKYLTRRQKWRIRTDSPKHLESYRCRYKIVVILSGCDLVNKGILEIPITEEGKFTKIVSINANDGMTNEEIKTISLKTKVSESNFFKVKKTGELSQELSKVLKNPVEDEGKDKPGSPSKLTADKIKPKPETPKRNVAAFYLNVRSYPANSGKSFGTVFMHTEPNILGEEKSWYNFFTKVK